MRKLTNIQKRQNFSMQSGVESWQEKMSPSSDTEKGPEDCSRFYGQTAITAYGYSYGGKDVLVTTNREINQIAMYTFETGDL